jgi:DNA-binding NtrC family response regulator
VTRSAGSELNRPNSFIPRRRALLVDHDAGDLQYYSALLRGLGCVVHSFATYREAEGCLEREVIDFVIVNQGGPAFEARELVERVLARNRRTPVVVLTHSLDMGCYLEAMQLGAADYLEKPLSPADLERLVTTVGSPRLHELHGQTA